MTLDGLKQPKRHSCRNEKNYCAYQKNLNEDRFILSVAKCRLVILVSRYINYMQIFAGVPREGLGCQMTVMVMPCIRQF